MTYDQFLNFLDQFEEIQSFRQKIAFATQNLQRIGSGSGRIVYDIDGTKVFKIAKNAKGVAQNEEEINIGTYEDSHNIVTKIYEYDPNGSWIVAEKAKKVSEARIKQLTGIPSLFELFKFLKNFEDSNKGGRNIFGQEEDVVELLNNNEFVLELEDIIANYSISAGDLGRASTYGEVIRNGKPTIVLTDYGLTDEVYSTHYSPQRKQQYQIYEMFNFANGNDDMLGDLPPQDAIDTRRGMWAQMPYSVDDGGGVINEGFISFVLARDKYPKKLPSAPYVLDEFHNVVNNITEVLRYVSEKKKFYNNLLALQEWLIEQKLYDRDPLLKEEYEINEITNPSRQAVKPYTLEDKNYAIELANAFMKKINIGVEPEYIDGGSNGHAFQITNDVVLKITADKSEADAAGKLLNEKPKYVAEVYSFYKIIDTIKNIAFFAILQENIQDKPISEFLKYSDNVDKIKPVEMDFVDILMKIHKALPQEMNEIVKHILTDMPEANISLEERESTYDYLIDLINIQEELRKYGIKSSDYGNPFNLGYKNGILKFFDIGGYKAHEPTMTAQDIVYLPEDGSAKFSTDTAMGQDEFPAYNNIDNSPSIQNDLNANSHLYNEDLEYNHVDDATKDQYVMSERVLSSMAGSSTVDVKKKCRLGGLGNTSAACNQGDIRNLDIKPLTEAQNQEFLGYNANVDAIEQQEAAYLKKVAENYIAINTKYLQPYLTPEEMETVNEWIRSDFKTGNRDDDKDAYTIRNKAVEALQKADPKNYEIFGAGVKKYLNVNKQVRNFFMKKKFDLVKKYPTDDKYGMAGNINVPEVSHFTTAEHAIGILKDGYISSGDYGISTTSNKNLVKDIQPVFYYPQSSGYEGVTYRNLSIQLVLDFNKIKTDGVKFRKGNEERGTHFGEEEIQLLPKEGELEVYKYLKKVIIDPTKEKNISILHNLTALLKEKNISHFVKNQEKNQIREEVNAKEMRNDLAAIKSILNKKRGIAFVEINKSIAQKLEKKKIGVIPTRMITNQTMMAIIFNDKIKAYLLYDIAKNKGGYLDDKTPEEAREIGKLLDYTPSDIEQYIHDKYGSKVPVLPEKSPNDFDDLAEEVSYDFWDLNEENINNFDINIDLNKLNRGVDKDEMIEIPDFPLKNLTVSKRGIMQSIQDIRNAEPSKTNEPVLVFYNITNKTFLVEDGYHRVAQAYLNKEQTIPVQIYSNTWSDYVANINPENKFNLNENENIINSLKGQLAQAAQKIYDEWEQDENGEDCTLGVGGICQDIAEAMCNVLLNNNIECRTVSQQVGNQHVYVIAKMDDGIYDVDIPPYLYEEGAGYCWKKISDVEFNERYIVVNRLSSDPNEFDQYTMDESKMLNEVQIMALNYLPFREDVEEAGGKIYSVGGAVRDEFLGKESKDLDILITGVPFKQLEQILNKYGRVDAVGKSFGVLKFKPKGATEDIDIAIPRMETPTGEGGHQGFDIKSDHALPIEKDLERRDFTINAIAKDIEGNIIDPFGGQEDIKNKIIRVVNPKAFSDDPLRMLRAISFASRFNFTIEPETMKMIQDNAGRVKEIAPERILTEFDKILRKDNILTGVILLHETGLLKEIFGKGLYYDFRNTKEPFDKVRTMGEFVYLLSKNLVNDPAEFYKSNLKGDENSYKEIKALQIAFESGEATNLIEARSVAHNIYIISPTSLQSQILPNVIKTAAQELLQGKYPKTVNELAVNGNDLMQVGLQGKAIGDMQKSLLLKIYANKAMNNKEELLSLAGQNKSIIKENNEINKNIVYHGTSEKHNFDRRGNVYNGTFFSTDKNEAKAYGNYIYSVKLKPNLKLFDTKNLNDSKVLINEFKVLYDDYYDEATEPENYYIKTAEQLYNHEDNWNPIERTNGVLEWLDGNYDGVWVYEGGVKNLLLFNPVNEKIENITKENSDMIKEDVEGLGWKKYNNRKLYFGSPSGMMMVVLNNVVFDKETNTYLIEMRPLDTKFKGDIWTTNMSEEQLKEFITNGRVDYNHPINGSHVRLTTIGKYDALQNAKNTVGFANAEEIKEDIGDKIEYGALLLFLDIPIWNKITSIINKEDLYDKEGYGIEPDPHVTILYGFHDELTAEEVFDLYKLNMPLKPIELRVKGINIFETPEFDVVKFDVESDILKKAHQIMKDLPNTENFPDYHPHITIAYVKKGEGKKYVKPFEKERILKGNKLIYSTKGQRGDNGEKLMLDEGVADKYAEKTFNIPDPNTQGNVQAMGDIQKSIEEPYAYVKGKNIKEEVFKIPIFKNPKSLTNFAENTRAIVDADGNLYVAQQNGWFNHGDMGFALHFSHTNQGIYDDGDNYQLLHRIEKTNGFGLGDSSVNYYNQNYDNLGNTKAILREAKRKNPQFDFYFEYYMNIESEPISIEEFAYPEMQLEKHTWNINGELVDINFFVKKYDIWNHQGGEDSGYKDPSEASVFEFIQNNYEDFIHDETLKKELLQALTDRELLNEGKSDYSDAKTALMRSKSIDAEMKEKILKYFTGGSTYKEGGHVHGLTKPKELMDKTPKAEGVSMGADKDGFFVYTHRQRSKSYESPEKISIKDINFTESTG